MTIYPLIFEPMLKPKIWGGRRLETLLGKRLGKEQAIGESWEIVDLGDDRSIVAFGPDKGRTLTEISRTWGSGLTGRAPLCDGRFPLLIKFLDATANLSVQVHPDQAMADRRGGEVRVKNEAWYVVDAAPGSSIYRGLRDGVDAEALRRAVDAGNIESVLNTISARKGHCYYLPSGTIHALGAGVLVAEVQTPSDLTYRLHDWNRTDPVTGKPRELHVEDALACVSLDSVPAHLEHPEHIASVWTSITSLVRCKSFVIERVRMVVGVEQEITYEEMVIWIVLEGRGTIHCDGLEEPAGFGVGDTVLVPAGLKNGRVQTQDDCMWLEVSIPIESSLAGFERPDRADLNAPPGVGDRYVPLNVPDRGGAK